MKLIIKKKQVKPEVVPNGIYSKSKKLIGLIQGKRVVMINRFFEKGYKQDGCKHYVIVSDEAELALHVKSAYA